MSYSPYIASYTRSPCFSRWVLKRNVVMVQLKCEDDVAAANELFGNDFTEAGPDLFNRKGVGTSYRPAAAYYVDLCSAAAALGFCEHDVFAAVCAGTCDGEVRRAARAPRPRRRRAALRRPSRRRSPRSRRRRRRRRRRLVRRRRRSRSPRSQPRRRRRRSGA